MQRMALERLLEIISVASEHIPTAIKAAEPMVDWSCIAGIGDRLENTHDRVEPGVLWSIARETLGPLKVCAERHVQA
jgi:uncharacterized protein with HEPN domain